MLPRDLTGDEGAKGTMAHENHWLLGFNFNVEEWDATAATMTCLMGSQILRLHDTNRSGGNSLPGRQ
jgi:hypothetical protein